MAATSTSTVTSGSKASMATNYGQQLPATLRWRPLPAPLVEEEVPSSLAVLQTPDQPVPCRRCLQDSRIGDELLLLSYDPFLGDSPYRCASPIFVHSKPACKPVVVPASGGDIPEQLAKRLLAVRAYDGKHMMQGSEVVNGDSLLETCQRLLGDGTLAEYCHVHFATPGCFAVRIEKSYSPNQVMHI